MGGGPTYFRPLNQSQGVPRPLIFTLAPAKPLLRDPAIGWVLPLGGDGVPLKGTG